MSCKPHSTLGTCSMENAWQRMNIRKMSIIMNTIAALTYLTHTLRYLLFDISGNDLAANKSAGNW